jgi:PhnB protein
MMEKRVAVIPYLSFNGNCEEAVNVYMAAFGGEIIYMSRWEQQNCGNPQQFGKVMHVEFVLGSTPMGAGDNFDFCGGNIPVRLMVHMSSMEEARRAIDTLAQDGGAVLSPLRPHPAPDDGGCGSMTRDRFGYFWIVTCPNPDKQ